MSLICDVDSRVRSKLLLTDLEAAKRAEFERRRKLRLQQVRQQSCEFASKIRKNVDTEVRKLVKNENKKIDEQCKAILEKQHGKIRQAMESASTTLLGAQKSADIQDDLVAVVKEKEDLQNALARARGTIASRKENDSRQALREKDTNIIDRKSVVRQIENTRSALVARLPPVEPKPPRGPQGSKPSRPVVHRSKPPDSPSPKKDKGLRGIIKTTTSQSKDSKSVKLPPKKPTECTIASPLLVRRQVSKKYNQENKNPGLETSLDSSGCYDSDSTWPPRSAKVTKTSIPETIRVYNHNDGKCSEFIRPWKSVTHLNSLTDVEMASNLEKEESQTIYKADLDERRRKQRETRGARALKKERARQEFENMIQRVTDLDKQERIRRAVNVEYPPEVHVREPFGKIVPRKKVLRFEDEGGSSCAHFHEVIKPAHTSGLPNLTTETEGVIPVNETRFDPGETEHNDDCLRQIVDRMGRTREKLLREGRYDSSDEDDVDVPRWISDADSFHAGQVDVTRVEEDARVIKSSLKIRKGAKKIRQTGRKKGVSKKKSKKIKSPRKKTVVSRFPKSPCSEVEQLGSNRNTEDPDLSFPFKEHPCDLSASFNESFSEERKDTRKVDREIPETPENPSNGTSSSSSSSFNRDVKVTVEIMGKKKKKQKKGAQTTELQTVPENVTVAQVKLANKKDFWSQTLQTPRVEYTSSSTSYNSPPEHLSPDQQNLLVRALSNVQNKNKENPKLREYIGKLLTMSRQSVSDLEVSTTSDISIDSDIFTSRNRTLKQPSQPRRRIHLASETSEEIDGTRPGSDRKAENQRTMLDLLSVISEFQRVVQNRGGGGTDFDATRSTYAGVPDRVSDPPIVPRSPDPVRWRMSQSQFFERSSSSNGEMVGGRSYDLPRSLHPDPLASLGPIEAPASTNLYRQAHPSLPRRDLSTIEEASVNIPRAEQCPTRREMALSDAESTISSISGSPARPKSHPRKHPIPMSPSSSSDHSTFDLITTGDVVDAAGVEETSTDLEEAFRSLGLNWALSTLKRTRDSKRLSSGTSSEGRGRASSSRLRSKKGSSVYKHSTPLERTPERGASVEIPPFEPPPQDHLPHLQLPPRERLTPPNLTLSHPFLLTKPS